MRSSLAWWLPMPLGLPFSLGAFVFGVGSVAAIGFVKQKSRVKEDTVIGLVFTGFFALGLVLVSKTRSNIDLTHILFGNVLGISAGDVQQTLVISVLVLVLLLRGGSNDPAVQQGLARRILNTLTGLGPCFIKLGQALSHPT